MIINLIPPRYNKAYFRKYRRIEALACFKRCKMKLRVKISLRKIDMKIVISILIETNAILNLLDSILNL
jgi:hypothetical protein